MTGPDEHRVGRLLRWYPRRWRDRYGDEFAELLRAELAERPRSWRRTFNVARSGLLARCTAAGITSHDLPPAEQIRAGLATLCCAVAAAGVLGVFMLAQLATGWQWSEAAYGPAAAGTLIMAAAGGCLGVIAIAAALPAGWCAVRAAARGRDTRLAAAIAVTLGCGGMLVEGALHFQNGWPGTGGTGAEHGLVPAGIAAFGWASTLSVSAYWMHPELWGHFPAAELAWMALSPLAWAGTMAGVISVARRLDMPPGLQAYLTRLAAAATVAVIGFVVGAGCWVLARGPGQGTAFRPGLIDTIGLLIMTAAAVVALRAAGAIRRARITLAGAP